VGKLVFDTSVTPHWLATGDRFWYSYETSSGRSFYIVDPVKKTKAPLFDNAKMAAMLTEITRTPHDAHHLPIRTVKFTKNDSEFFWVRADYFCRWLLGDFDQSVDLTEVDP
jgi:dipeptidyl-peptidase 4